MTDRVFAELRKQFDKALQAARTMVDTAQSHRADDGRAQRALCGEIPSRQYGAATGNNYRRCAAHDAAEAVRYPRPTSCRAPSAQP